ncbi:ArsR/SmtB family transcription factor [Brevibacillus dissolubilis]|uniref:ArsR/SmtB family transcription factor n=1 Tax=Brevibacillus dissolubilis TaxID=1844116 RepID=UPI0011179BF8|nr:metalloregulator ArsR/SmtB family transcription factor [Brevibacillus dissolubilis]
MGPTELMEMMYLADIFKLLGDKTRLTIMALLHVQSLCVRDLVEILQASQPSVSQHLAKLKMHGLVKEHRKGAWVFYSINGDNNPMMNVILRELPDMRPIVEKQQQRLSPAL